MATAITPLANLTLSSAASNLTFSSISGSYRDLYLVFSARTTRGSSQEPIMIRFNGDSGANYARIAMYGDGSSSYSFSDTGTEMVFERAATASTETANIFGSTQISVMDYSATNKHKTLLGRMNIASNSVWAQTNRWASTSAVTSIVLTPYYGNQFVSGSTFALYGVTA